MQCLFQVKQKLLPLMAIGHHVEEICRKSIWSVALGFNFNFQISPFSREKILHVSKGRFNWLLLFRLLKASMIARLWTWYFSRTKILFVLWPCDIQFASTHYANPTLRTMGCSGKLSSSHKKMSSEKENTQHNNFTNIEALNSESRKESHVREKELGPRTEETKKDEDEEEEQAWRYHILNNRTCKMWIPMLIFDYGGILRFVKVCHPGKYWSVKRKEKHLENPPDKKINPPLVADQRFAVVQSEICLI